MVFQIQKIFKQKKICVLKGSCVKIKSCLTSYLITLLNKKDQFKIPSYLKRVKKTKSNHSLVLVSIEELEGFDKVNFASSNEFSSREEFFHFNSFWPLKWYPQKQKSINEEYVKTFMHKLKKIQLNTNKQDDSRISQNHIYANYERKKIQCTESCMIVDQKTNNILYKSTDRNDILHGVLECISYVSSHRQPHSEHYLCTDLDAFIINDPCRSCCMALVHGRIKRVFFLFSQNGTFENDFLHEFSHFNHRYEVFKIIF